MMLLQRPPFDAESRSPLILFRDDRNQFLFDNSDLQQVVVFVVQHGQEFVY